MTMRVVAALAMAMAPMAPARATIYRQSWTGQVSSGTDDSGFFGGGDLTGQSFTATYLFDDTKGQEDVSPDTLDLHGGEGEGTSSPSVATILSINGMSVSFVGTSQAEYVSEAVDDVSHFYSVSADDIYFLYGSADTSLPRVPGPQTFDYAGSLRSDDSNSGAFFAGDTYLTLGHMTLISGPQAADAGDVPEPASWALMLSGLGLVGGAMRRQRRNGPLAPHSPRSVPSGEMVR